MKEDFRQLGVRRWWIIIAISLAVVAFSLDLTVLNLALPTLATALHATSSQLQWIVDAYSLVLAIVLLPAGLLGDRYGRKKFMLIALVIFGLSSLACAYSTSANMLIASRVSLGIGGAFVLPLGLSILPIFFNSQERPKAMALLMGSAFLAYPLGPILGGWLLTNYRWGSVFLINVPIVILAIIAIAILLPENSNPKASRIDLLGIILSSFGLTGVTYGIIQAEATSWSDWQVITSLIVGVVLLSTFVWWQKHLSKRKEDSLVNLTLFQSPSFTWGTLLATGVSFTLFGLLFTVPQFFQTIQGKNALVTGVQLLWMIGGLIIGSVLAEKLALKVGAKIAVTLGFAIMAVGLIIGTGITAQATESFMAVWITVVGLGLGFAMPTAMDAAIGALSVEESGVGSALVQAIRQVGGTFGVAILGTIVGNSYRSQLHLTGLPDSITSAVNKSAAGGMAVAQKLASSSLQQVVQNAFVYGVHDLLWVCAGIAVVSSVLTLIFLPNKELITE